jgi:hypothetical protein
MATLVLGIAGSAIGGAVLPGGLSLLGSPLSGAAIGSTLATIGGAFIDQALLGPLAGASGQTSMPQGPRVSDLKLGTSSEGTPLPRVYGRARLPGQLIWATRFKEKKEKVKQQTAGGKSVGGATTGSGKTAKTIKYTYFANVAYALCEGPIDRIGTVWADGKKLKKGKFEFDVHLGAEDEPVESFIANKEGGEVPAYRGTAYVVFKNMALESFGNRLPQLNIEVFRSFDGFEDSVRAVTLIPAMGEFAYATDQVIATGGGVTATENLHTTEGGSDWSASIDQLEELLPNVSRVALVVGWFGTDLRIGECELRPGVETASKTTEPIEWVVAGVARDTAYVVSQSGGRPAYGGTPADASVISAIQDLKDRGFSVTFYPFIAMDVPAGNGLPNPYGGTGQPPYPWRGRVTCTPAPGEVGTVDKTATCAAQVAAFVGSAAPGDFSIDGGEVTYSGPDEWSFRRFILHCASLCEAAGGVDAFIMGSEMIGATTLRSSASTFPFVDALVDLAADVKEVLSPGTLLTYGANWTEHPAYVAPDGSGDVYFHLDPLWASANIDAVGIDVYWPLSDWRDGEDHLDYEPGRTIYDLDYLKGNCRGGEAFDFYYPAAGETGNEASAERLAQTRTAITDGAYGKPWVYKPKAIKEWWQNEHYNRPAGIESGSPTDWVPQSKPIWFTELGCPAVDKGSNQPNVFIDPKSSESFAPFFSRVTRDDLMQRRYIEALSSFFDPDDPDYVAGSNPTSVVYDAPMVDVSRAYVYTWDARPYPAFPLALSVWADGGNWELGHWLTGRAGGGDVAAVVAQLLEDYGFTSYDVSGLAGTLDGYAVDRLMSARDALQPLSLAYFIDAHESGGLIHFTRRGLIGSLATVTPDDLVETAADQPLYTLTRGQETELPLSAKITFVNEAKDYAQAAVEARHLNVRSDRVSAAELPIVMRHNIAQQIAESWLRDVWAARERASFALPPSRLALEPSDVITLDAGGRNYRLRLTETSDGVRKTVEARSIEPRVYEALRVPERPVEPEPVIVYGPATAVFLDLPIFRAGETEETGFVAADASPWPGAIAFYRSPTTSGFELNAVAELQVTHGATVFDFYSGPLYRYDRSNTLRVSLTQGELASITEDALLAGGNLAAVENEDGDWELLQFQTATLVAPGTYDLSVLLRGQFGSEATMRNPVAAGARFILLDEAVTAVDMVSGDVGLLLNWRYGPLGEPIDDLAYRTEAHAFSGLGLRPLSPVRLQGKRDPVSGDWTFIWVRRTRIDGDGWEAPEVPLGEAAELYQLEILDGLGGDVLRSIDLGAPSFLYTAAMQTADFGSPQWNVAIRVTQMSASYGAGAPAEALTYDYQH